MKGGSKEDSFNRDKTSAKARKNVSREFSQTEKPTEIHNEPDVTRQWSNDMTTQRKAETPNYQNQQQRKKQPFQFFKKYQHPNQSKRPAFTSEGERDPYALGFAPLNVFENQIIPMGIHNLSKSFRPNLATIRVLSLGMKFIPKTEVSSWRKVFSKFEDFRRKMNNKMNVLFRRSVTGRLR